MRWHAAVAAQETGTVGAGQTLTLDMAVGKAEGRVAGAKKGAKNAKRSGNEVTVFYSTLPPV
jgi:hypothetical protein